MSTIKPPPPPIVAATHNRAVQQALYRKLAHLKDREAIRQTLPQAFGNVRGGVYGTLSTTTLARALVQSVLVAYTALRDGVQSSDLKQLPTLYPEIVAIICNANTMTLELGEMDTEDILELGSEFLDIVQVVTSALANALANTLANKEPDEEELVRAYGDDAMIPDKVYLAAHESLSSTHDIIVVGFHIVRDGFSILDLPALMKLYPEATSLATNAPLALQGWKQLSRKQKAELGKLAIDVVENIWATLEGPAPANAPIVRSAVRENSTKQIAV
jgi:hypothetical protein